MSPKSARASHRWTGHGVGMLARRKLFKDEGKDKKGTDEGKEQKGNDEGTRAIRMLYMYMCTFT